MGFEAVARAATRLIRSDESLHLGLAVRRGLPAAAGWTARARGHGLQAPGVAPTAPRDKVGALVRLREPDHLGKGLGRRRRAGQEEPVTPGRSPLRGVHRVEG